MATSPSTPQAASLKHPPGLYALFAAEMWERLSYYGMRALLVLYLVNKLKFDRKDALELYAVYTGLVYLTPLIGGRLADRYLGQRKAIFIGGLLMALGQFVLIWPESLYLGLGLLIVGNGFFKPNISTMVGGLYPVGDARRDSAYTLFYMGINLGAFLAPWICGTIGQKYDWWPGFMTAGIGMLIGLGCFLFTQRFLQGNGLPPGREAGFHDSLKAPDYLHVLLITAILAVGVFLAINFWPFLRPLWSPEWLNKFAPKDPKLINLAAVLYKGAILVGGLSLFIYLTEPKGAKVDSALHQPLTAADWAQIAVIVIISLFSVVFWMGFEQSGGTLNLFADEKTNLNVLGWEVPSSGLQSINPLFIIVLAPVFAALWLKLDAKGIKFPSFAKMGLGLLLLGLSFIVMYFADKASESGKVSMLWLIVVYFIFTVAELFLSPIGLSLVNKLAPTKLASLMMAFWFLCTAAANYLAGIMEHTIEPYHWNLWLFLGIMAAVPGLLMLVLTPVLLKMSHGKA